MSPQVGASSKHDNMYSKVTILMKFKFNTGGRATNFSFHTDMFSLHHYGNDHTHQNDTPYHNYGNHRIMVYHTPIALAVQITWFQ